jgi:hypothetical protein
MSSFSRERSRAIMGDRETKPAPIYTVPYVRWVLGDDSIPVSKCHVLYAWSHPPSASVLKRLNKQDRERVIRLVDYEEMGQTRERYSILTMYQVTK